MENNEILERLLQDDKQPSSVKEEVAVSKQRAKEDMQISRIRVVTAKYKVYIVLLLIFICILLITYIPKENDAMKSNRSSFDQVNSRLDRLKNDIEIAKKDMDYLCNEKNWIIYNDDALKNCLNTRKNCSELPTTWKTWTWSYDLTVPVSYLQTNSLYNKKMPVDEKRVLKNLNEYLIKQNIWNDRKKVWEILKIEIWDPKPVEWWDNHFFKVSLDVEIKFDTVGDLTGFLYNVEKKMIDNREDRILYKIQSVSYDVVANDEPQITDISMMAYYYHDEKFDDKNECTEEKNTSKSKNDKKYDDNEDTNDSDSFIQKILGNFKK